jgi:hypothetical protein
LAPASIICIGWSQQAGHLLTSAKIALRADTTKEQTIPSVSGDGGGRPIKIGATRTVTPLIFVDKRPDHKGGPLDSC